MVWYPTGSCSPAFGGSFIAISPLVSPLPLLVEPRWLLRLERVSISALASVVSDGSPGSSKFMAGGSPLLLWVAASAAAAFDRVRGRLAGGLFESIELVALRCLVLLAGEVATSSPEASREDGWRRSVVEDLSCCVGRSLVRLRLAELPAEEGEDMLISPLMLPGTLCLKCDRKLRPAEDQD